MSTHRATTDRMIDMQGILTEEIHLDVAPERVYAASTPPPKHTSPKRQCMIQACIGPRH